MPKQSVQSLRLPATLRNVLTESLGVLKADRGVIFVRDSQENAFYVGASVGLSQDYLDAVSAGSHDLPFRGPSQRARLFIAKDARNHPQLKAIRTSIQAEGFTSLLIAPLLSKEMAQGELAVCFDGQRDVSSTEKAAILSLANLVATAIANAHALERDRIHSEQLEVLRRVTRDITRNLDLKTLFSGICKSVCDLLGIEFCRLLIRDEKTGVFTLGGSYGEVQGEEQSITTFPPGQGIVHRMASLQDAVAIREVLKDPDWVDRTWAERAGVCSFLGIPLLLEDRVVGAVNCLTQYVREFRTDEIQLMKDFASRAVIALENARAFEKLKSKSVQLAKFSEINRQLTSNLELDDILEKILEAPQKLVDGRYAWLFLYDETLEELIPHRKTLQRFAAGARFPTLRLGEGLTGWVAQHRKAVLVHDPKRDPRWVKRPWNRKIHIGPYAAFPLVSGDTLLGVFGFFAHEQGTISEEDFALLTSFADQAAIAIKNARLYAKTRETNERLTSLVQSATDGIISVDLEGRITSWNPGAEALYGYSEKEVLNRELARLFPEAEEEMKSVRERLISGKNLPPLETTRKQKDGTLIEASITLFPLRNTLGRIIGVSGIHRDIGAKKRAELGLRKSEEKYRTLFEQARDAIEILNEEGELIDCNQKTCELLGCAREELVGEPLIHFLSIEDREAFSHHLSKILKSGKDLYESVHIRKDGTPVHLEISAGLIELEGRKRILLFLRDITERKRAEQVLRFTQFCLDRAGDAVFWITPAGRIVYANDAARASLGYSREELLSMSIQEINPAFLPETWSRQWKQIQTRGSFTLESHHRTKGGRTYPVEIALNYLELEGQAYCCAFVRDITERKEAQQMLMRSDRLAALGRLVAGTTHEILNPANIIGIQAQMLRLEGEHSPVLSEASDKILRNVQRIAKICHLLRRFSRIEKRDISNFGIVDLLRETISMVEPQSRLDNITFSLDTPGHEASVVGDRDQLAQVFLNLFNNARDAMPDGGCITIRIRESQRRNTPWVSLSIEDQGVGISHEHLPHIFDPFFTTKDQHKGTGLGLSIVHSIIEDHGGFVDVRSTVGRGTTFQIHLPLAANGDPKEVLATLMESHGASHFPAFQTKPETCPHGPQNADGC